MRREAPEPWASAMHERGMLHGQRPSFAQLATAARPFTRQKTLTTQAVIDIVTGKTREPADDIVRALAQALARPVEEVARWIGRPLDVGTPYVPPNGADRLSRKQRDALDHLIRVMIDEGKEGGSSGNTAPTREAGETPAITDGELADARARGRSDRFNAATNEGYGGWTVERDPLPDPELESAYQEGWLSISDAEYDQAVAAARSARGEGAHKGQYGKAARRAPRQRTDDAGDGA